MPNSRAPPVLQHEEEEEEQAVSNAVAPVRRARPTVTTAQHLEDKVAGVADKLDSLQAELAVLKTAIVNSIDEKIKAVLKGFYDPSVSNWWMNEIDDDIKILLRELPLAER